MIDDELNNESQGSTSILEEDQVKTKPAILLSQSPIRGEKEKFPMGSPIRGENFPSVSPKNDGNPISKSPIRGEKEKFPPATATAPTAAEVPTQNETENCNEVDLRPFEVFF